MKKLLIVVASLLAFASTTLAQSDDFKKWEFYGGYSALKFDNLGGDTGNVKLDDLLSGKNTLRGFELAVTRNFHKYLGAKFDYSLHLRNDGFSRPAGSGNIDSSVQNFLGGLQVKNNSTDGRLKPFAHALFGVAHQKISLGSLSPPNAVDISDFRLSATSFSMAFGGGIDIKLNHHLDVRAIQIDLNVINRGDTPAGIVLAPTPHQAAVGQPFIVPGTNQDNLRIGAGIVIH